MFVTGPNVIKTVTNEDVSFEDLGGAMTHNTKSGVAHFAVEDDEACIAAIRRLLSFLPQNNVDDRAASARRPIRPTAWRRGSTDIVPAEPNKPLRHEGDRPRLVVDDGDFFEVHEHFAPNIVVGFARLDGRPVGVVGEPARRCSRACSTSTSSIKAARFVRFCDAFNIPLVTFEDVPGFLPGTEQECGGIIRHGAKLLYAYCEATVPKLTVDRAQGLRRRVRRHVLEAASAATTTWRGRGAELAVMGAEGAVRSSTGRRSSARRTQPQARAKLVEEYNEKFANPYVAAALGYLDDVIEPQETRPRLIRALRMLANKRQSLPPKKHGQHPALTEPPVTPRHASRSARSARSSSRTAGRSRSAVCRTLREMGDRIGAPSSPTPTTRRAHVFAADEACADPVPRPPRRATSTRARSSRRRDRTRRDAIHPGYGFLAESADFAEQVADARASIWIGPTPEATRAMGDKVRARALAIQAGVPGPPGTEGPVSDPAELRRAARVDRLPGGAEGGGGRRRQGMRRVNGPDRVRAGGPAHAGRGTERLRRRPALPRALAREAPPHRGPDPGRHARDGARAGRARLLDPAPAPEARRGDPFPGARRRAAAASSGRSRFRSRRPAGTRTPAPRNSSWTSEGRFYFLEMNARLQVGAPGHRDGARARSGAGADPDRARRARSTLTQDDVRPVRRLHRVPRLRGGSRPGLSPAGRERSAGSSFPRARASAATSACARAARCRSTTIR